MYEYLLRACNSRHIWGHAFDVHPSDWPNAFHPKSLPFEVIEGWGNLRLKIEGSEISFSDEVAGIQIAFEDTDLDADRAEFIVEEIRRQAEYFSGQSAEFVRIA